MRRVIAYDPATGSFTWTAKTNKKVVVGRKAGTPRRDGYIEIQVLGRRWFAHRLAWAFVYGPDVPALIDNVNTLRSDNRIENIRSADKSLNALNTEARGRGASGLRGVSCNARRGGFDVSIKAAKQLKYIGHFACENAARAAYVAAKVAAIQEMIK